jgi:hypothetical protein
MSYTAILLPVKIDSSLLNHQIRFGENSVVQTVSIANGTYFLRGDGTADDLCLAIKTALDSHTGANTYTVAVSFRVDPSGVTAVVTISRTGANVFQIFWADALTTFDEGLLGFTNVNTANNSTAKSGTLSPSSVWVSDCDVTDLDRNDEADGFAPRANSGRIRDGIFGGPYDVATMNFELVDGRRTHSQHNTADPNACFNNLWRRWIAGRPCEIHELNLGTYPALGAASAATLFGSKRWHIAEASRQSFNRRRRDRATSLWSFTMQLHARVS